jgi:hypothetical protein
MELDPIFAGSEPEVLRGHADLLLEEGALWLASSARGRTACRPPRRRAAWNIREPAPSQPLDLRVMLWIPGSCLLFPRAWR